MPFVSATGAVMSPVLPPPKQGSGTLLPRHDNRMQAVPLRLDADARTVDAGPPVVLSSPRLAVGASIVPTGVNSRAQYAVAPDGRFLLNVQTDGD